MSYLKPRLSFFGRLLKVTQGQPGVPPGIKPGLFYQDAWPFILFNLSLTICAYEADE
jgi:hypothetical protein